MSNLAAQCVRHQLTAVADTQNGHAQRKQGRINLRRSVIVNAVGAACEDDALGVLRLDFLQGFFPGHDFAVYMMFSDTAGNQLIILTAEVQNEDHFLIHYIPPFL